MLWDWIWNIKRIKNDAIFGGGRGTFKPALDRLCRGCLVREKFLTFLLHVGSLV